MEGGGDNWSYKTCKAPFKMSPPTNQHPVVYRPDALPVAQPTVSQHWREQSADTSPKMFLSNRPTWTAHKLGLSGAWEQNLWPNARRCSWYNQSMTVKLENKCIALATMRNSFNGPQHSLTWDSQHQKHTIHIHLLASQSFLQNLLGGPKISKFGHVTQTTPT